jgi:hypothetical protein
MHGAIPPLSQYAFMAWCSVNKKKHRNILPSTFYLYLLLNILILWLVENFKIVLFVKIYYKDLYKERMRNWTLCLFMVSVTYAKIPCVFHGLVYSDWVRGYLFFFLTLRNLRVSLFFVWYNLIISQFLKILLARIDITNIYVVLHVTVVYRAGFAVSLPSGSRNVLHIKWSYGMLSDCISFFVYSPVNM